MGLVVIQIREHISNHMAWQTAFKQEAFIIEPIDLQTSLSKIEEQSLHTFNCLYGTTFKLRRPYHTIDCFTNFYTNLEDCFLVCESL